MSIFRNLLPPFRIHLSRSRLRAAKDQLCSPPEVVSALLTLSSVVVDVGIISVMPYGSLKVTEGSSGITYQHE